VLAGSLEPVQQTAEPVEFDLHVATQPVATGAPIHTKTCRLIETVGKRDH